MERNEGILVRVSIVIKHHDQKQVGEAKIYHNLKRVAHHPAKTGKKLKGRIWMPELMKIDCYLMIWSIQTNQPRCCTVHSELGLLRSNTSQEDDPQLCSKTSPVPLSRKRGPNQCSYFQSNFILGQVDKKLAITEGNNPST